MTLLLMAAGRGSRYGKLKQFDQLGPNGEFIMEYSLRDAIQSGFKHIVVVTQKSNVDFLQQYLSERLDANVKLDVVAQELNDLPDGVKLKSEREKPLGTAHAVWSARNVISSPFAVINTDDYYGKRVYAKAVEFIDNIYDYSIFGLLAYNLKETLSNYGPVSRGVCKNDGGSLISIDESFKIERQNNTIVDLESGIEFSGNEYVSMNFWICMPTIFEEIEADIVEFAKKKNSENDEVYLPYVIRKMVKAKKASVEIIPSESKWFGVTYANDKEKAVDTLQEMTQSGLYSSPLWNE